MPEQMLLQPLENEGNHLFVQAYPTTLCRLCSKFIIHYQDRAIKHAHAQQHIEAGHAERYRKANFTTYRLTHKGRLILKENSNGDCADNLDDR